MTITDLEIANGRSHNFQKNRLALRENLDNYESVLRSNVFEKENVAKLLNMPAERVVGTFSVDTCDDIKISIDRPNISASVDERDVLKHEMAYRPCADWGVARRRLRSGGTGGMCRKRLRGGFARRRWPRERASAMNGAAAIDV
jgi:hypothetical protein